MLSTKYSHSALLNEWMVRMLIGGTDTIIHGKTKPEELEMIMKEFHETWPFLEIEYAGTVELNDYMTGEVTSSYNEIFFYKNSSSRKIWDEKGRIDEAADTMVFITFDTDCISFVSEEDGTETKKIVDKIVKEVRLSRGIIEEKKEEPQSRDPNFRYDPDIDPVC